MNILAPLAGVKDNIRILSRGSRFKIYGFVYKIFSIGPIIFLKLCVHIYYFYNFNEFIHIKYYFALKVMSLIKLVLTQCIPAYIIKRSGVVETREPLTDNSIFRVRIPRIERLYFLYWAYTVQIQIN